MMASGTVAPEIERVLVQSAGRPGAQAASASRRPPEARRSGRRTRYQRVGPRARAGGEGFKIKDNQQAQSRLALEKSLVDLDGRIELKALQLQSAEAQLAEEQQLFKEGLVSQDALRRTDLGVRQARVELAQLRDERKNAERATNVQLEGLSLERGSLDKEAAQARRLLDLSTTKSDRDGVLTWVVPQEGVLVRRGDVIARIADLTSFASTPRCRTSTRAACAPACRRSSA